MFEWLTNGVRLIRNGIAGRNNDDTHSATSWPDDERDRGEGEKIRAGVPIPQFLPYYDNLQNLGETQKMRTAYRQMPRDAFVKSALYSKIASVMATELKVNPKNKKDVREQMVAEFVTWCLADRQKGGMPHFIWCILSGMLIDGFSLVEPCWELEEDGSWQNKEVIGEVKPKDVDQDFVLEVDAFKNITNIKGLRYNAGLDFDPKDFIIAQHLPLYSNPTGQSDLAAAYRSYFWLDTVTKLRGFGAEKRAFPVVAASFQDATRRPLLEQALSKIKSSYWFTYPEEVKLQLLQLAGSADDYFKSFRADSVEEIVTSISWASLQSVGGKEGQIRGDSTVHKDTADLSKWVLCEIIKHVLNDHKRGVIRQLCDRNFSGIMTWPKASFGGIDEAELKESLAIDEGLTQLGWVHSREDLAERYGRRWGMGEDALQSQQVQTPPGGGKMPGDLFDGGFAEFSDWVELQDA